MDAEASDHPELNKYPYSVTTSDPKGLEDLDSGSSFPPEVPDYHEALGAVAKNEVKTQKTSDYYTKMDLDVANIDKSKIKHGGPSMSHLTKVTFSGLNYFPDHLSIFVKSIQMSLKTFQLIYFLN